DDRMRTYRRLGPTEAAVERNCMIQVTASREGLHVTASRAISFGEPDEQFRREMETACRWTGVLILLSTEDRTAADVIASGMPLLERGGFEHEWRLAPIGWGTGYAAQEQLLLPDDSKQNLKVGWSLVWQGSVGAVTCADTMLVTEEGPQLAAAPEY